MNTFQIIRLWVFAFWIIVIQINSAETKFPPKYPFSEVSTPTLKAAPTSYLIMGSLKVQFDKTTLGEVIDKIGAGRISHDGDASESVYWICYSITESLGVDRIWMLSSGEMGGNEHVIYGIVARASDIGSRTESCPELPRALRPVSLDSKIWLRTPISEIKKGFGEPSFLKNPWMIYQYQRSLPLDSKSNKVGTDPLFEIGGLSVKSNSGSVIEVWANKFKSD